MLVLVIHRENYDCFSSALTWDIYWGFSCAPTKPSLIVIPSLPNFKSYRKVLFALQKLSKYVNKEKLNND